MKKILVILTGGTIGSRIEEHIINVSDKSPYQLLAMYEEEYGVENFDVIQPINVLSENMTPDLWLQLFRAIKKIDVNNYDGIIVTHGSDTLSYTAAFMGMLFHDMPVPVVLVASNYPLGQKGSNGLSNFANAVCLIREHIVRGVFVVYQDNAGINQVYLATRITEADPLCDQFGDFAKIPFGRMENGHLKMSESEFLPTLSQVNKRCGKEFEIPCELSGNVLAIRPYPGLDYSMFDLSKKPVAVLHYLYHSATACANSENKGYEMLSFAEKCKESGIDFYTASHKSPEGNRYVTGDALLKAGVTPLYNISFEAAYAKIMLGYHQKNKVIGEKLQKDIYFETVGAKNMLNL